MQCIGLECHPGSGPWRVRELLITMPGCSSEPGLSRVAGTSDGSPWSPSMAMADPVSAWETVSRRGGAEKQSGAVSLWCLGLTGRALLTQEELVSVISWLVTDLEI